MRGHDQFTLRPLSDPDHRLRDAGRDLIFVPSVARFREDYLLDRLERAQIASLALWPTT